jgi:hypothetical protein
LELVARDRQDDDTTIHWALLATKQQTVQRRAATSAGGRMAR